MSWSPGFFRAATKSTLSPSLTMPASSWFWSPSSESALSVPLSWARTPTWVRGLKRRVVTCSPSSVGSVATRPASWSALEIAPGTTLFRGTSVDEVDDAGAEIRLSARGLGRGDTGPHDLREPAGDAAGAAVLFVRGHVEADPRDHVVLRTRARALDRVVHGEEQLGVVAGIKRVLHLRRVPLRAGVREVVAER